MRKLSRFFSIAAIVCAAAAGPAAAQSPMVARGPTVAESVAPLQPGDAVKLTIWREPDLSGEFPVNSSGDVVFPKIGTVRVTTVSADSLKRFIVASYAPFLRDPSIDVTLLRRVTVAGFVKSPGLYKVDATMTVSDVLALAGGPAPDGVTDKVELVRDGKTVTGNLAGATRIGESALRSGDQLYVPQRSWLSRNTALVATVVSSAAILAATLIRN